MNRDEHTEITVKGRIVIKKSPQEIYPLWRDFRNLPQIFDFLDGVTLLDDFHSIWSFTFSTENEHVVYSVEITEDIPNKLIRWHSHSTADILQQGEITFLKKSDHSTDLQLSIHFFFPPLYDKVFFSETSLQQIIEDNLARFERAVSANQFPQAEYQQDNIPEHLPHPNNPAQPFQAEPKKGDSHKRFIPPPKE